MYIRDQDTGQEMKIFWIRDNDQILYYKTIITIHLG